MYRGSCGGGKIRQYAAKTVDHVSQTRQVARIRQQMIVDERTQIGFEFERGRVDFVQAEALTGERDLVDFIA